MWFLTFLLVVLLDCVVFGVPVLVYRFAIRKGEPIQGHKKAFFINLAFFCAGTVALVIFNTLCGVYEDPNYRFQLGIVDVSFMGLDYYLLTFKRKSEPSQSKPRCTKCGAPLSPNAKFCNQCGEKYVPKPVVNTMICPNCGKTIKPTNFCSECGSKISQTPVSPSSIQNKPSSGIYVDSLGRIQPQNGPPAHTDDGTKDFDEVRITVTIFVAVIVAAVAVALGIMLAD